MALGMKRWLGLVAVGMALVAIRTLPPEAFDAPEWRIQPTQAERYREALSDNAVRANMRLQRLRWANTIIPATLAGDGPVAFLFPDGAQPDQVARARQRALAEAGTAPSDVAVGLFFLSPGLGSYSGAPGVSRSFTEYYFGERDGRAYCAVVRPTRRWSRQGGPELSEAGDGSTYLGLCSLVRAHGLPGPAVRRWLAGGGTALAKTGQPSDADLRPAAPMGFRVFERRGVFGRRPPRFGYRDLVVELDRCLGGVPAGCAQLFEDPNADGFYGFARSRFDDVLANSPVSAVDVTSFFWPADAHVVADLAQEFGEARFRQWWTADGDVRTAFQDAFGEDVGEWNLRRIGQYVAISRSGPIVSSTGLLSGFLLLVLSSVVAGGWARGRRVA